MIKRITGIIITLVLMFTVFPVAFAYSDTSGTYGYNLTWVYDTQTKTLTLSGEGQMEDREDDGSPWYMFKEEIETVVLDERITALGVSAFSGCKALKSIVIPDGVKSIGNRAFASCTSLKQIEIPDSVERIGDYVFNLCVSLTSITIPDSITTIPNRAFSNCINLARVNLPDTLVNIAHRAFYGCKGIKVIYLPQNIQSIESGAFESSFVETVYYSGSTADQKNYYALQNARELDNALWVYEAEGMPDHQYDDKYDKNCNICGELRKVLTDTTKIFSDVFKNSWFREYVDYSYTHGIFTGTTDTSFSPNDNITRAQFVQVLANISGVDTTDRNVTTSFKDVPDKKWYSAAVKWASENYVVNGMGNGEFAPNANVTREQMCLMLVNFAQFKGITLKKVENKESFVDDGNISKWAKSAVYTCQQADIVNGKGAARFDPRGTGTRAEASVMFAKFHKNYIN